MTDKEVMQLALDNLIDVRDEDGIDCVEAILKLRAALAQPKREWQGLTDEQVDDIGCDFATLGGDIDAKDWFAFYLAIEAKLKEKNNG
jgi:hypothetical protein